MLPLLVEFLVGFGSRFSQELTYIRTIVTELDFIERRHSVLITEVDVGMILEEFSYGCSFSHATCKMQAM